MTNTNVLNKCGCCACDVSWVKNGQLQVLREHDVNKIIHWSIRLFSFSILDNFSKKLYASCNVSVWKTAYAATYNILSLWVNYYNPN